jgi:hypothetical protein
MYEGVLKGFNTFDRMYILKLGLNAPMKQTSIAFHDSRDFENSKDLDKFLLQMVDRIQKILKTKC